MQAGGLRQADRMPIASIPVFLELVVRSLPLQCRQMADKSTLTPGMLVKVTDGAFAGQIGVVLDSRNAVDSMGHSCPPIMTGHYWVKLTLPNSEFQAHLYQDEIEPMDSATGKKTPET